MIRFESLPGYNHNIEHLTEDQVELKHQIFRNIMVNKFKKLTTNKISKIDDTKLYQLYLLTCYILGEEYEIESFTDEE